MTRNSVCSIIVLLIGTGYWLSTSAADPRGTPRERDLQTEVDQLRLELNELRSRLDVLESAVNVIVRPAGGPPNLVIPGYSSPHRLPGVPANPNRVPVQPERPSWVPEGSVSGEINGHTYYIIPLNGNDRATTPSS